MANLFEILKQHPKFIVEIDDELLCIICKKVLIDAHCMSCGCQSCGSCIESHMASGKQFCPGVTKFCNYEVLDTKNVLRNHVTNRKIQRMRIECLHGDCDFVSQIVDMVEHLRTCEYGIVDCDYREMGCDVVNITRRTLKSHIVEAALEHSALLAAWAAQMRNGVEQSARESQAELEKLTEEIVNIQKENNYKMEKSEFEIASTALKKEMEAIQAENASMKQELRRAADKPNVGSFFWLISDLPQKQAVTQKGGAQSILSDPFYSHQNGYKMRLEAFVNNYYTTGHYYFNMHFVIVRGPHDNGLEWPCNKKIHIHLLNADNNDTYASQSWDYAAIKASDPARVEAIMGRPTTERNPGCGMNQFVSWSYLAEDGGIMKNGAVVVKCEIE